jgi:hypothetical protein
MKSVALIALAPKRDGPRVSIGGAETPHVPKLVRGLYHTNERIENGAEPGVSTIMLIPRHRLFEMADEMRFRSHFRLARGANHPNAPERYHD